jgi:hypothetical protein
MHCCYEYAKRIDAGDVISTSFNGIPLAAHMETTSLG